MAGAYEEISGIKISDMDFKLRRLFVGLISLGVVLVIYLLYSQLSETPLIEIDTGAESTDTVEEFGDKVGMVGDVGVSTVEKAVFQHLNESKEVDREFGFEKLLHEATDEWEIEKPFLNIYQSDFKCYLTAEKGRVKIETAAGRPSPKDAILTGNVVAHIIPEADSDIGEGFVYLSDVVFNSEESRFSTVGPVKFVSKDAQMLGKGLEVIYNDQLNRLEYLRIVHLESLKLRTSSKVSLLSSEKTDTGGSKEKMTHRQSAKQTEGESYRCVFSKNVVIDTPEQLVFADEIAISRIRRGKGLKEQGDESSDQQATTGEPQAPDLENQKSQITITCDNGILVTPVGSDRAKKDYAKLKSESAAIDKKDYDINAADKRTKLVAESIDYNASTGDTSASRPKIVFYVTDIGGGDTAVPVSVTSKGEGKFLPALNQVSFEGDCVCTMLRAEQNFQQKYTLLAPKVTVDLSGDGAVGIEHLTAEGGTVRLATVKTMAEELLGGVELKCSRFDYDNSGKMFLAKGPGVIKLDNSKISESKGKVGKFDLRRQCYALVENFETLKYSLQSNRIIADGGAQEMFIGYVPVVDGEYGQQIKAGAGHIEADLYETDNGQLELITFSATDGITYEEKDIQFSGSELFYDAGKFLMTVNGDEFEPCFFNGAVAEGVEYDLKTGRVRTKIVGPGLFQPGFSR